MIDVDFEWFSPSETVDFHGLKNLLKQLFDVDNQLFDLSELTNLILEQPALGSTARAKKATPSPS
jgi:protein BCP1